MDEMYRAYTLHIRELINGARGDAALAPTVELLSGSPPNASADSVEDFAGSGSERDEHLWGNLSGLGSNCGCATVADLWNAAINLDAGAGNIDRLRLCRAQLSHVHGLAHCGVQLDRHREGGLLRIRSGRRHAQNEQCEK